VSVQVSTFDLPLPPAGWFDLAFQALPDGSLARFQADFDVLGEMRRRWAEPVSRPRPWPPYPPDARARIQVHDGLREVSAVEFALPATFLRFDRLSDGRWVVADARCRTGAPNARIVGRDGVAAAPFALGDGIADVQADDAGTLWVGYFDEGVFGADINETTPPLGAPGLNRFDLEGRLLWSHDPGAEGAAERPIYDCEALNVFGDEAWCCGDTPGIAGAPTSTLFQFRSDRERCWDADLFLVKAIAICAGRAAAIVYGSDGPYALTELALTPAGVTKIADRPLPDLGLDGTSPAALLGRGPKLHVVEGSTWTVLSLDP
jgi:hypothetical protein